jgi:hypothetical protein
MLRSTVLVAAYVAVGIAIAPDGSQESVSAAPPSTVGCVAVAMPTVQGVPGSAAEAAVGVRDLIVSYLTGPSLKVVVLESRLASEAAIEAKQQGCEPLLVSTLTRKSGGKLLMKTLGHAAGAAAWMVPGGGSVAAAAAQAATAAGLQTVSVLASSTKAKDEVRLEYRLQSAAGQVQFGPKTERQRATTDGEDLLTPVVMRAAEAIVGRKSGT